MIKNDFLYVERLIQIDIQSLEHSIEYELIFLSLSLLSLIPL